MDVRILGWLEVVLETGPVVLPRGRGRALLALLALRPGEVVAAERLIDQLWGPEPPPTANKGLHNLVSDLRKRLVAGGDRSRGPGGGEPHAVLATTGPGYALRIEQSQVDAHRFRHLVSEASGAPPEERAAQLRAALELWRGPALADFAYQPFAQAEIAALDELRLMAIEERVDADLILGRHAALVGELEGLVAEHPFRERLRAQLMLALYRGGRQADALDVYQAGRRVLIDELGIEPGAALADLEQAILGQDPSLQHRAPQPSVTVTAEPLTAAQPWLAAELKTVTVAYIDLGESSTTAAADPELVRRLITRYADVAASIIDRHGGTVEGLIGGVMVAVFGVPTAREDDALRAVRAVVELRDASTTLEGTAHADQAGRVNPAIGVNTGEVVVSGAAGGSATAPGDVVKLAARLQQAAGAGEVLIGETTRQLLGEAAHVESVASLVLDRRGRPAAVWRLLELAPRPPTRAPDLSPPLVGREHELTRLRAAFQRTLRQRRASRLTVIGEAGVGKSRLSSEFIGALPDEIVALSCRASAHGQGMTFWPLRDLLLQATGDRGQEGITDLLSRLDDAAAAQIAEVIGLGDDQEPGREVFPAVRRLLEVLAEDHPMVVVVDDAHWAEPTFLELVDHLAESVRAPVLIVCLGRPELTDSRPGWVSDPATSLTLEPLSPDDAERLARDRLAGRLVPDEVVTQVAKMADGNPLFIEQLFAALRDEGKVRFPPSLHALLAARLDVLGPAERDLLRCASVIGMEFSLDELGSLVPERARRFLGEHLDTLRRKELLLVPRRPGQSRRTFAFRHVLIQQAAYRSTTREVRAQLHLQLADRLEQTDAPELEVVAHHLERAYEHRRHLGLADELTDELALRAGQRLAQAGLRAYHRFDMTAAATLLERARAILPTDHAQRHEVLRRLAQAYPTLGRLADAEAVLEEMLAGPHVREDPRLAQRLRLEQLRIRLIAGPDPVRHDVIRAEVMQAIEVLEPLGDDVGISQACYLLATMHLRAGEIHALEQVGRRGLEHARRSGDLREQLGALWWPAWALVAGPTPVTDAIAACEELLHDHPQHIAVMTDLARLHAMRGGFDTARELAGRARRDVLERIRVRRALTVVAHRAAEVEILAGDLGAAEQLLRDGLEVALDVGERDQTSQIAAALSRVLCEQRAMQEAASFAALSRQHAPAESVTAQALWRTATARPLALAGDTAAGERLAREALALVPVDMLNLLAEIELDLGHILLAAGQEQAARSTIRQAVARYRRKGNLVGARRAAAVDGT